MKKIFIANCLIVSAICSMAQTPEMQSFKWEEKPSLHVQNLLEQKEASVVISDQQTVEYLFNDKKDLDCFSFRHRTIAVNEDKAVAANNRIYLPTRNPDNLVAMQARTISKSGVVKELGKKDMKQINEDGTDYLILALEGLDKGMEVEYYYLLKRPFNFYGSMVIQSSAFIRHADVQIISPDNLEFSAKSYNGFSDFIEKKENDKRKLSASKDSIPVMLKEQFSGDDANLMRVEYKLSYNHTRGNDKLFTYNDAGKRYFEILHEEVDKSSKELKAILKKNNLTDKTDEEKISGIENYVKQNFQIAEESDESDIAKILKNKYGGETGIIRLYIGFFEAANINYEIVITTNKYEKRFDPDFESWTYLQTILFHFPDFKKYLAPANILYRYGIIPFNYIDNYGLFIKSLSLGDEKVAVSAAQNIPLPSVDNHTDNMDLNITFPPDFSVANVKYLRKMSGYSAVGIRPYYSFAKDEDRKKIIDGLLKEKGEETKTSNIKVTNFNINSDDVNKPFTIECNYTSGALIEAAGDNYLLKIGETIGAQSELYSDKPRTTPVIMEFPHSYIRKINVTIPDGYIVKGADKLKMNVRYDIAGREKTIGFISDYTINGNVISVTVNEYYNETNFPISRYEEFRKVINAAADFNKITIVLSKK